MAGNPAPVQQEMDEQVEEMVTKARGGLTPEQEAQLSKVLFPDTHTGTVEFCGADRTLRPLTVKWAKKMAAILQPISQALNEASLSTGVKDAELELADALVSVGKLLAEFYGWEEEVVAKLEEEEVDLAELQALVVEQGALTRASDFLLIPLRVVVGTMRLAEVAMLRYQALLIRNPKTKKNPPPPKKTQPLDSEPLPSTSSGPTS